MDPSRTDLSAPEMSSPSASSCPGVFRSQIPVSEGELVAHRAPRRRGPAASPESKESPRVVDAGGQGASCEEPHCPGTRPVERDDVAERRQSIDVKMTARRATSLPVFWHRATLGRIRSFFGTRLHPTRPSREAACIGSGQVHRPVAVFSAPRCGRARTQPIRRCCLAWWRRREVRRRARQVGMQGGCVRARGGDHLR